MTAYIDVPEANALYEEQAKITSGLNILDNGGTIGLFTVVPPAPVPPGEGQLPVPFIPSVQLATVAPSPAMITEARNAMVARYNAITAELSAMGVTGAPAGL